MMQCGLVLFLTPLSWGMMPTGLGSILRKSEYFTETWSLHYFFFCSKIWNIKTSEKLPLKLEHVSDDGNNFKGKRMFLHKVTLKFKEHC
jgi:hypothetical protein